MTPPKLLIRKRMLAVQGRPRPTCFVQAQVDPAIQGVLESYFMNETLFRRGAYATSWPEGTAKIPPALAPAMASLLKNDACPEISVKTLLGGQMHQAANAWEMMAFELIAKVAFDNLVQLVSAVIELDSDVYFLGSLPAAEIAAFEADASADVVRLDASAAAA
jgi:hypothetical protein